MRRQKKNRAMIGGERFSGLTARGAHRAEVTSGGDSSHSLLQTLPLSLFFLLSPFPAVFC